MGASDVPERGPRVRDEASALAWGSPLATFRGCSTRRAIVGGVPRERVWWHTRLRRASGRLWSPARHASAAVHHVEGHVRGSIWKSIVRGMRSEGELHGREAGLRRRSFPAGHQPERRGRSGPSRHCRAVTACLFDTLPMTECHLTFVDRLDQQATSVTLWPFHTRYRGTPPSTTKSDKLSD